MDDIQSPLYTIRAYNDKFYKVVKFFGNRSFSFCADKKEYDKKLESSFSRARSSILDIALSNKFKYFFTGTIDKSKFDRYDIDTFIKSFSQFIRDERKRTNFDIRYLVVPEKHKDGAYHLHGLIDISDNSISLFDISAPYSLRERGYYNWLSYASRFGFCSLGIINDNIAVAFYILKYICKDIDIRSSDIGKHLYFCSRNINRSFVASQIYEPSLTLDSISSQYKSKFLQSGYCVSEDWTFPFEFESSVFATTSEVVDIKYKSEEIFDNYFIDGFLFGAEGFD